MKRILLSLLIVALLVSAVYAAHKVGNLGWSYSINTSKPNVFDVRVKGMVENTGKEKISSVVVKIDIFKKSDNTKVTTMSATVENIAVGAKANFIAGPAMVVPSGTKVPDTYYYRVQQPNPK